MKHNNTAISMFEQLPEQTRKKLNLVDLEAITGAVLIKDRIYGFYQRAAKEETQVRRFKRSHGYCGGRIYCLAYVGKEGETLCRQCKRELAAQRGGEGRKNNRSAYGRMRLEERRQLRESED